jgi:hypothetical protein
MTLGTDCTDTLSITALADFNCAATFNDDVVFGGDVDFGTGTITFPPSPTFGIGCGASTITLDGEVVFNCDVAPSTDNTVNLGSPTQRFANIYTGDLHLKNDRGDWTVIEEETYLSLRNNTTGKTFRLVMEEVTS